MTVSANLAQRLANALADQGAAIELLALLGASDDVTLNALDLDLGSSGNAGSLDVFPTTASKGKIALTATNNAGNTTLAITNQEMAAARSLRIPDPLADADFLLGKQAAVARTATADGLTTGIIADGGMLQHITVTSANATDVITLPTPTPGTMVVLNVGSNGFKLQSSAPATVGINGGTGASAKSTIAASSTLVMICVSATSWKGFFLDGDSDVAKVPAAA
jgi:hypothetical protein